MLTWEGCPMSRLMDLRVRGLTCPTMGYWAIRYRSETFGDVHNWLSRSNLGDKVHDLWTGLQKVSILQKVMVWSHPDLLFRWYLQVGSSWCPEYVSMETFSMVTSESSNFLCFRLQRLRTSSDTGRRAIQVRIHKMYSLYWILNNQSEEKTVGKGR